MSDGIGAQTFIFMRYINRCPDKRAHGGREKNTSDDD